MKKLLSSILAFIILASLLGQALAPRQAIADSTTSTAVASFAGCATGNVAGAYLSTQLGKAVNGLVNKLKDILKNKLVGGLTTVPVSDSTTQSNVDYGNTQFFTKAYVTDIIARCGARVLLDTIINNTFNIMRTAGRNGGVTFVTNWVTFQTQAQYRGENIFRAELSTAKLCGYLADGVKKSFGVDPKVQTPLTGQNTRTDSLQTFSLSTNCTLPTDFTPQAYQQNFAAMGGWDTFARILEPQNNIYGITAISQDEIQKQRALQVSADLAQANAGRGYIGISGDGKSKSCAVKAPNGVDCIVYNNIKTTGSYIADNVAASINAELGWITSAQGLGSLIANATQVLVSRLFDEGNPNEGNYGAANDTTLPKITLPTDTTGSQAACTSTGAAEQAFMLPLLLGGTAPQSVVTQTNAKFNLTTGNEAAYYASGNTIGLPEFYMAGPTNQPDSPAQWGVVIRCTGSPGTGTTGGSGGGGNGSGGTSDGSTPAF